MQFTHHVFSTVDQSSEEIDAGKNLTPGRLMLILIAVYFVVNVPFVVEILLLALLYATIIDGPVQWLERWRLPRRLAIVLFDTFIIGIILIVVALAAPVTFREIHQLRQEEPAHLQQLSNVWADSSNPLLRGPGRDGIAQIITMIKEPTVPPQTTLAVAKRFIVGIVGLLTCLVLSYYYLTEKKLLRTMVLDSLSPPTESRVRRSWDEVERAVGGWLRGRLLLGLIVGIVTTIVFGVLQLPYWSVLGVVAGLSEPIPILGPWIGGAPAIFLALTKSTSLAIVVVLFVLLRQGIVDAVFVPRVMKRTIGLSPLTVFVAVVMGTRLAGAVGALLAIPVAAAIQVIIAEHLEIRRDTNQSTTLSGWRWLRDRTGQSGDN